MACITVLPHLTTLSGARGKKEKKNGNAPNSTFPLQLYFYSKVTISKHKHRGEHCEMHYCRKHQRNKNSPIWINSKYFYDSRCYYWVWKFPNVTPIVKSVSACVCFAYIWGKASSLFILTFVFRSDHGQPPSDEPRVADSYWYLSLQHSAGWELHPALTWRLQLYRLAPRVCVCVCAVLLACVCVSVCVYTVCAQLIVPLLLYCHWVHKLTTVLYKAGK